MNEVVSEAGDRLSKHCVKAKLESRRWPSSLKANKFEHRFIKQSI